MSKTQETRTERDSLGSMQVPKDAYYGPETEKQLDKILDPYAMTTPGVHGKKSEKEKGISG